MAKPKNLNQFAKPTWKRLAELVGNHCSVEESLIEEVLRAFGKLTSFENDPHLLIVNGFHELDPEAD